VADLRCAGLATGLNVLLNLAVIPVWGFMGAAGATLASEVVWLVAATRAFRRHVVVVHMWRILMRPVAAGAVMAVTMVVTSPLPWPARLVLGVAVYAAALLLIGGGQAVVGLWAEERQPR